MTERMTEQPDVALAEPSMVPACQSSQQKPGAIDAGLLAACIHCGLCLPACPTYLASGRETESPRGRIYLLGQWNSGQLPLDKDLYDHVDSCLGCLGCQTACPSGVQYEKIINQARPLLAEKRSAWQRFVMRTVFAHVLPNYWLLRLNGIFLRLWQALKIDRMLAKIAARAEAESTSAAPHLMPPEKSLFLKFAQWHEFLPAVPHFQKLPARSTPLLASNDVMQLFSGCMMDIFYNHVNRAAINLLVAQNRTVNNPRQTCCGALAFHAGEADIARDLAKRNIEFFESTAGPIAVTAAGCGAMMKEYNHLLSAEPDWSARADKFSSRVVDITEALASGTFAETPKAKPERPPIKVAYHAACHLAHAQSVRVAPNELLHLLALLPGVTDGVVVSGAPKSSDQAGAPDPAKQAVTLVPLKDAEHCCGSAGIYNLLHPEMALRVLDMKMDNVQKTGADVVVSTNPGCLLQLEAGVRRRGLRTRIKHLCELLADYYL